MVLFILRIAHQKKVMKDLPINQQIHLQNNSYSVY